MGRENDIDELRDGSRRFWPAARTGDIRTEDNAATVINGPRPMDADELAEWDTFDDETDREADAAALKDDLELAKTERDQAQQTRLDMDPATGIQRWTRDITVAGTGDTVRIEQRIGHLQAEVRQLNGAVRVLSAMLVRMIRAQRLDE